MRYLVRSSTGLFRGWICALKGVKLGEGETCDIVRAAIGSWSPLELTATYRSLEITVFCCFKATLEVVTLPLPWSPLEVGAG